MCSFVILIVTYGTILSQQTSSLKGWKYAWKNNIIKEKVYTKESIQGHDK